jgi:hypothetical protein
MLPYLLAIAGGYLIGNSKADYKMENGGEIGKGGYKVGDNIKIKLKDRSERGGKSVEELKKLGASENAKIIKVYATNPKSTFKAGDYKIEYTDGTQDYILYEEIEYEHNKKYKYSWEI